jgi:hypothetical protein
MPPEEKWASGKNALHLEYKFEFMPKGIVNQLSAELHRYIQNNEVWNNAVNLTINDTKSQIIEVAYDRVLTIATEGGINAQGINTLIMDALKNIIDSYKGIFIELVIWEDFIDSMSRNGLQDEYNKAGDSAIYLCKGVNAENPYNKE